MPRENGPSAAVGTRRGVEANAIDLYVATTALEMLATGASLITRDGTLVSVDLCGFTRLTERLARAGREGAEEITAIVNRAFEPIVAALQDQGGDIVKFGGDAALALFHGVDHVDRGLAAAVRAQRALAGEPLVQTSQGAVRLRASVGVEAGPVRIALTSGSQREVLLLGPAVTRVIRAEAMCRPGSIAVGQVAAERCDAHAVVATADGFRVRLRDPSRTLARPYDGAVAGARAELLVPRDVERIVRTQDPNEHRRVVIGFLRIEELDHLAEREDDSALEQLDSVFRILLAQCDALGLCLLNTDVNEDGVKLLVTAGAPAAVEDGELRLALAMRRTFDESAGASIRAGIARGAVFAGDVGSSTRRCYTVLGDSVNLAARLAAVGSAGEIVMHGDVAAALGGRFVSSDVEYVQVKGKRLPAAFHRLGSPIESALSRTETPVSSFGRLQDLEGLRRARRELSPGAGRVIDVVGDAGIGKTHLLNSIALGPHVFRTNGEVHLMHTPFGATAPLVRTVCGIAPEMSAAEAGIVLEARVRSGASELLGDLPYLAIAARAEVAATVALNDVAVEFRRERLVAATGSLIGRLLPPGGCIICDDTHWLDEASASLIAGLSDEAEERGWLMITARRPASASVSAVAERWDLRPLDDDAANSLALALLDREPPSDLELTQLVARAGGNPLFLRELCEAWRSSSRELPETIEVLVAARIDELRPEVRALLSSASVLGSEGAVEDAEALHQDQGQWLALTDFVTTSNGRFRFRHDLIRATAYERLPRARRRALHARAARILQARAEDAAIWTQLSTHYFEARDNERALRWSLIAAEDASNRTGHAEAAVLLERALTCARSLHAADSVAQSAEALATAYELLARPEDASAAYQTAIRSADTPEARARLGGRRANALLQTGHYAIAHRCLTSSFKELRSVVGAAAGREARRIERTLLLDRAAVWAAQCRYAKSADVLERVATEALDEGDPLTAAKAWMHLEMALSAAGDPRGIEFGERAIPLLEEHHAWFDLANVVSNLGVAAMDAGDLTDAATMFARAGQLHERVGHVLGLAVVEHNFGAVQLDRGELASAEETYEHVARVFKAARYEFGQCMAMQQRGRLAARRGKIESALQQLDSAEVALRSIGAIDLSEIFVYQLEALVLGARWREALERSEAVRQCVEPLEDTEALPLTFDRLVAIAMFQSGDREGAISTLRRVIQRAREQMRRLELALALHAHAEISQTTIVDPRESWLREEQVLRRDLGIVWIPPVQGTTTG